MDRPHATPERVSAAAARRAAQARAARAAAAARPAAAARRRAALAALLLLATAGGWIAFAVMPTGPLLIGLVPTVLLVSVLGAGRTAVVAGKRNDERLAEQIVQSEELAADPRSGATRAVAAPARGPSAPTPKVTGRAVRPSEARTEVFAAIVTDQGETGSARRHATGATPVVRAAASDDESWEPVPVPRPTYTMKPAAPRRQPAPLGDVEASTSVRPAAEASEEARSRRREASGSIDLNAVLAKRRAAGE